MNALIDLAKKQSEPKKPADFFREHSFRVFLWSDAWKNTTTDHALKWHRVRFGRDTIDDVPEVRGMYALTISIKNTIMPPHAVIVYFGKTARTLRKRYHEYVRDSELGAKRRKFQNLFTLWVLDLDFHYAPIDAANHELRKIELALNDSVLPYCVTNDFSATIRSIVPILRE